MDISMFLNTLPISIRYIECIDEFEDIGYTMDIDLSSRGHPLDIHYPCTMCNIYIYKYICI